MTKAFDKYLVTGSVNGMNIEDIASIVKELCSAYDLDYRLKPFEIIPFSGKATIYFSKSGCDALAAKFKLSRKIIHFDVDANMNGFCEIEVSDGTRTENEYAFRFLGKKVPNKTGGSDTVPLDGKELALEKMKLISSAKRRATLTFVGATLTTAEESYSNATFELQATEEPTNILPPAITETPIVEQIKEEKKVEVVQVEQAKPVEVKEPVVEPIIAPVAPIEVKEAVVEPAPIEAKVRVDFEAVAKEYIKEHYKTQKNFKEVLGATVADVVAMLEQDLDINPPAIKAFIEAKSTLLSEPKVELFDFNTAVHKSLICKEIDNLIGTEWKKDKPVLNKIIELIKDLNCPMTELTATLKTLNLQAIKG